MSYFLNISDNKRLVKMNNQKENSFDLIVFEDRVCDQITKQVKNLNSESTPVNMVWKMRNDIGLKVYLNVVLVGVELNFNPFTQTYDGSKVISFTCTDTEYYAHQKLLVGQLVYKTKKRWKDYLLYQRIMKLTAINDAANK